MLFSILGIEALLLPYFLSKDVYGEVEFYKFSAFLAQFLLFGSGTGYVVRYLKSPFQNRDIITFNFYFFAYFHALFAGIVIAWFSSWAIAILSFFTMLAMIFESTIKVKEKYLLAMSFKPLLSFMLICFLPLLLLFQWQLTNYLVSAYSLAIILYVVLGRRAQRIEKRKGGKLSITSFFVAVNNYTKNIKSGFVMNASTAMMFGFFYIDRAIVRDKFPELLGDYSLSYSIMQLTIVAITTFSYVNLIEFGKEKTESSLFKKKLVVSFKKCSILFLIIGSCSIVFSYGAEQFYNYEQVFETTILMVVLFGISNVFSSLNSAHLYLGSVHIMTAMMLFTITASLTLNWYLPFKSINDYYILLGKTYGLYLLFSLFSGTYIFYKLHNIEKKT